MDAQVTNIFESSELFTGMSRDDGDLLLDYFEWVLVSPGQEMIREGDVATFGMLVVSGSFEILKWFGGQKVILSVVKRGTFVGDTGLIAGVPRYASCRALESGHAGLLSQKRLSEMCKEAPSLYSHLIANFNRILSNRIIQINEDVLRLSGGFVNFETTKKILRHSM